MQGSVLRQGAGAPGGFSVLSWPLRLVQALRTRRADLICRPSQSLARYQKIVELASLQAKIGIWECDLATNRLTWSEGVYDLFDLPRHALVTRAETVAFYHPTSRREMEAARARAIAERSSFSLDAKVTTAKGNERWMRLTGNVECDRGRPVRLFGMKQDITEERALLDRLRLLAETDLLSGLANRSALDDRLRDPSGALLLMDLDGFKQINDTKGHAAGDECIRQVAARLRCVCPSTALVARMGGDEFAVVLPTDASARDAETLGGAILAALASPIAYGGEALCLSGSIGIAVPCPGVQMDGQALIVEADAALYAAKDAGRNRLRVFSIDRMAPAA